MENIDELPAVLTVEEMGRFLRIGRNQAYAAVKSGRIPSIRFNKKYLIPRDSLKRLLDNAGSVVG